MKPLLLSVLLAVVIMPFIFAASIPDTEVSPPDATQVETMEDDPKEESLVVEAGPMKCGNLSCPAETTICRISNETKKDNLSEVIQTSQCLDNKRNVLIANVTQTPNRSGKPIKAVSESTTSGSVYYCINCEGNPKIDDMLESIRKSFIEAQRIQRKIQDDIFKTMRYGFGGNRGYGMRGGFGMGYGWPFNPYWF